MLFKRLFALLNAFKDTFDWNFVFCADKVSLKDIPMVDEPEIPAVRKPVLGRRIQIQK